MTVRWLRVALTVVVVTLLGLASTTSTGAASFVYDAPAIVRVDPRDPAAAEAGQSQLGDATVGSASTPAAARVTSTTPNPARNATEAGGLPGLSASRAQLEAKFKHAADFGVVEGRGASGFDAFGKALDSFVADSGTVRVVGTYRGNPAILNYNPTTAQVVVQATDGTFVSGWQMSPAQLQNVITNGSLGGG